MEKTARISAIERLRMGTDGKGIRTLIGFFGCPLRCRYCVNKHCCVSAKEAKLYTVEELYETVRVDHVYFSATGGGVAFGGGEPLLHTEFLAAYIRACGERTAAEELGFDFTIETSLAVPRATLEALLAELSVCGMLDEVTFIVDIKSLDPWVYCSYTGRRVRTAKRNLMMLLRYQLADRIVVRVPQIPNYAGGRSQEKTVRCLLRMGVKRIDRFSYITGKESYAGAKD